MGDFRIVIDCIGGHGQDRDKGNGEKVDFTGEGGSHSALTPEGVAQVMVAALKGAGVNVEGAKVIHWPVDNYGGPEQNSRKPEKQISDDLITGIRTGSFNDL